MKQNRSDLNPVAHIPAVAGVYFFKNAAQEIIYIGKAKCLKKRVQSYFTKRESDFKVDALLKEYASIDYVLTGSDIEAQLLEARLIKEHQPKYNVLLTSGNPFLYILFSTGKPAGKPAAKKRAPAGMSVPDDADQHAKHGTLPAIKLVRNKSESEKGVYFGPFIQKREARAVFAYLVRTFKLQLCNVRIEGGCLDYHLGICAGSCLPHFDAEAYAARLELARHMLEGNFKSALRMLTERIAFYSARQEFETARLFYEYQQNFDVIFQTLRTGFNEKRYATDVFAATTTLAVKMQDRLAGLDELKSLLKLPVRPRMIDCFDISHFQSRSLVGSCVRFTDGKPDKAGFRKFKIKTLTQQDDCAALREIVARRYTAHDTEDSGGKHALSRDLFPDLILIDGGKGQRNAVCRLLSEGCDCAPLVLSLAKREERLFTPLHPEGIPLDIHTPLGQLLIALRDYAHHFAISYHKKLRS